MIAREYSLREQDLLPPGYPSSPEPYRIYHASPFTLKLAMDCGHTVQSGEAYAVITETQKKCCWICLDQS
jgi:hypothetical protein